MGGISEVVTNDPAVINDAWLKGYPTEGHLGYSVVTMPNDSSLEFSCLNRDDMRIQDDGGSTKLVHTFPNGEEEQLAGSTSFPILGARDVHCFEKTHGRVARFKNLGK